MLINIDNSLKFTTSEFGNQPKLYLILGQSKKPDTELKKSKWKERKTSIKIEKQGDLASSF
jgi:hypothetical protein